MALHSIKCVLIGYFGHDAYCLFNKATGKTFCSRDVIFEEGVSHRTLSALPVLNKGEIDHVILQPIDNSLPTLDPSLVPTHITTGPNPSQALPAPQPPTSQTIC